MTTYTMIESRDRIAFTEQINAYLKQGWILHGNTTTTTVVLGNNGVTTYFQALKALTHDYVPVHNTGPG